jgi:hypothetical protein
VSAPLNNPKDVDNYIDLSVVVGTSDAIMFINVWNQGIDSHLEAFTESRYEQVTESIGKFKTTRLYFWFHKNEVKTLIRRLRELGTEDAETWANDIEEIEKVSP